MRKFLSKTMLLAALTALFLAATAAAASIGTGVVDADTLRVRTEPSTDASTITYLSDGTQVQVHGGTWATGTDQAGRLIPVCLR